MEAKSLLIHAIFDLSIQNLLHSLYLNPDLKIIKLKIFVSYQKEQDI